MKVSFESNAPGGGASSQRASSLAPCAAIRVSGGVFCSYRASLVETGLWDSVRLGCAARLDVDPEEFEQIEPQEWLGVDSLQALMGAVSERFELDSIRTLTRRHVASPQSSNFYAPMLRSWSRSFDTSAEHMLRGIAPLWRAALRHAGTPLVVGVSESEVHILLDGSAAKMFHASPALTASFEGVLLGLLDLVRPRPMLLEVESCPAPETFSSICRF